MSSFEYFLYENKSIILGIILVCVVVIFYKMQYMTDVTKKTEGMCSSAFMTGANLALAAGDIRDDTGAIDSIALRSRGGASSLPQLSFQSDYAWQNITPAVENYRVRPPLLNLKSTKSGFNARNLGSDLLGGSQGHLY